MAALVALAIILPAAVIRLGHGLARLVSTTDRRGGIDLRFRVEETQAWFSGAPVYGVLETADYPPASYVLFWPFVGWTDMLTARWIWAGVSVACLVALAMMIWRALDERPAVERVAFSLLPMAGYATHGTLVTGQLPFLVLAALVGGTLLLVRRNPTLWSDLAGAALIILSLVKPTLSAPVVWIAFLAPRRIRPAALIVGGYALAALAAASMQDGSLLQLTADWLQQRDLVRLGATYGNLQKLLATMGAAGAFLPLAVAGVLLTGLWVLRYRAADPWLLLGVTAIVTRLLTYHRSFDDLLVILPAVAAMRLTTGPDAALRPAAWATALALAAGSLAPRVLLGDVQVALELLNFVLPVLWMGALAVLALAAERQRLATRSAMVPSVAAGVLAA